MDFSSALEELFARLNDHWRSQTPDQKSVTDERVLRELSLPRGTRTRLCFFAVPEVLVSRYREVAFPLASEAGLVPVAGDELARWEGSRVASVDVLIERAEAVVADLSTGSSHVLNELRAATAQARQQSVTRPDGVVRQPRVAIVIEREEDLPEAVHPNALVIRRPPTAPFEGELTDTTEEIEGAVESTWLDDLARWLKSVGYSVSMSLEEEAERLLDQGVYRSAVVAAVSALEVTLRDVLEAHDLLPSLGRSTRPKRATSPFTALLDAAVAAGFISHAELRDLRETQRMRNVLIHSGDPIDGRRARPMVERTLTISRRLRAEHQ